MTELSEASSAIERDEIQEVLAQYADGLRFENLSPSAIHATKLRILDTLGALLGGYSGESSRLAREFATKVTQSNGATVIGTSHKTTPDLAAFANATTARFVEANDVYGGCHPSDVLPSVLAAAEYAQASGKDLICASALAYEVCLRLADATRIPGWDLTTLEAVAVATASAKVMGLSAGQIQQAISMALVPNNALNRARMGNLSMWKAVAAGQAGRAGVFAALLASEGFEGANLPFTGVDGWCDRVAGNRFELGPLGGNGVPFKIEETLIKPRTSCQGTISSILATEAAFPRITSVVDIVRVTVEVDRQARFVCGDGEHHWNPINRETADHSLPYVVGAVLHDGTVTPAEFDDAHLRNADLLRTIQKIEVVENEDFTKGLGTLPRAHRARVTVETRDGDQVIGETGGEFGDEADFAKSDANINEKFSSLTKEYLGEQQVQRVLGLLWSLETMSNVAEIPPLLIV